MKEIKKFEYAYGGKVLDDNTYNYEVDGTDIIKIDYPDNDGFVAIHGKNGKLEYIKAPYYEAINI